MAEYIPTVFRNFVLNNPCLYEEFLELLTPGDPYGKVALAKIYYKVVMPSYFWRRKYEELCRKIEEQKPPKELLDAVSGLLKTYGWREFYATLRYILTHWKTQEIDRTNVNRMTKIVNKLDEMPITLQIKERFHV